MRKIFLIGLLIVGVISLRDIVEARLIGTNPTGANADLFCNGGRIRGNVAVLYTEICQDYLGNWIPTSTLGTQALGTSALPWLAAYIGSGGVTNSGPTAAGAAGNTTFGTAGTTLPTGSVYSGLFALPNGPSLGTSGSSGLSATTTIPVNSSYETLISTNGNITMLSTPTLSTATVNGGSTAIQDGTFVILGSTTSTGVITLQSNGTLSGSQLKLGAATRQITQYKSIVLRYNSAESFLEEVAYMSDAN